ncbi:MAG: AAA family ATPase, partial [Deltaproteobacteria bacterium]|nr:AAA family ATPase [Deltaproteobacteria bacterium]MBW2531492.1 AAA family ATPase [Deltaproteobacteria bacterium]
MEPSVHIADSWALLVALVDQEVASSSADQPPAAHEPGEEPQGASRPAAAAHEVTRLGHGPAPAARQPPPRCLLWVRPQDPNPSLPWLEQARQSLAELGGHLERLVDGSAVAAFDGASVGEQASRTAQGALALHRTRPELSLAMVGTERDDPLGHHRVRALVQGASALLDRSEQGPPEVAIRLDRASSGLLGREFVVPTDADGAYLAARRPLDEPPSAPVGHESPCAGREAEVAELSAWVEQCFHHHSARGARLIGAPGSGKSRILLELVRSLRRRHPGAEIWAVRGTSALLPSPFGGVRSVIRWATGWLDDEPCQSNGDRLAARIARHLAPADSRWVTDLLGETVGLSAPEDAGPELRAARLDARLMADWLRRAWERWLQAECAVHPVLIVLDDACAVDDATLALVGGALRRLADQPLCVIASAEPGRRESFDRCWSSVRTRTITVQPRSVDAGRQMAVGALDALPTQARRALQAASVLGDLFALDAVAALLDGELPRRQVAAALEDLARAEWLAARPDAAGRSSPAFSFHHARVREVAYATLGEEDRARWHRRALDWLAPLSCSEPATLVEHGRRAGEPASSLPWYAVAAGQALVAADVDEATRLVDEGIAAGANWEELGRL